MSRVDGYASLNDYALLGDCHAGALVASDGAVDWLATPRLDSPPVCAALLDPAAGGAITVAPTVPYQADQRYLPDTMVLQTTFRCRTGTARVTDALNRGSSGPLPWTELARRIEVIDGEVPMRWEVAPGHQLGPGRPWVDRSGDVVVLQAGDERLAVLADHAGRPEPGDRSVAGRFTGRRCHTALLAVTATSSQPVFVPEPAAVHARLDGTGEFWRRWCADIHYDGAHEEQVRRSALTIKALTVAPRDAIAAALTTSLPERVGGERNFDYRFGWVRDHAFALDAMARLRLTEEVHAALSWLLDAISRTSPDVRALYTLDGEPASARESSVAVPGYRYSTPVRVGNGAADQLQIGAYGHLLDAVWRYVCHGGYLDAADARMLAAVMDHLCDLWRTEDAGLWELGDAAHYTSSKMGAWVALDRAVRLAEDRQLTTPHPHRWRTERDAVRRFVDTHCWSPAKRSYTFYAGSDELDASVLLAARAGFFAGDDPRLLSTIEAVRSELTADTGGNGPLIYRYSGMAGQEGTFVACTFWLIEALALAGRRQEAAGLMRQALDYAGTTGLYTEEIDPASGRLVGNLPQVLSHLAVIGAATALADTGGQSRDR